MDIKIIDLICDKSKEFLDESQTQKLKKTIIKVLEESETNNKVYSNQEYLSLFLKSKTVEGCSQNSLKLYSSILNKIFSSLIKPINEITTEDIRNYISKYQTNRNISKVSLDNIRRILSSLFQWLEDENYIFRNPMRRIHKIRTPKIMKTSFSDENINNLKDNVKSKRDLAIIEFLNSTGIRVGELTKLNIDDIDLENKECIVFGKGSKERKVYFDTSTKIHLMNYLNSRVDNNNALFVSRLKPFNRLKISGVEIMLKKLGQRLNIKNVHPHRFRRTLATKAIDKGMPIEQVQTLLGHAKVDTTMTYALINQNNVKASYRKIIG